MRDEQSTQQELKEIHHELVKMCKGICMECGERLEKGYRNPYHKICWEEI